MLSVRSPLRAASVICGCRRSFGRRTIPVMASLDAIRSETALDLTEGRTGVVARPRGRPPGRAVQLVRVAYLDNVKVLLVAVIIAAHGVAGYSWLEGRGPTRRSGRFA